MNPETISSLWPQIPRISRSFRIGFGFNCGPIFPNFPLLKYCLMSRTLQAQLKAHLRAQFATACPTPCAERESLIHQHVSFSCLKFSKNKTHFHRFLTSKIKFSFQKTDFPNISLRKISVFPYFFE